MGAVGGKERLQALLEVPLQIIGKGAEEHVAFDSVISLVKNRSYFQLHCLQIAEGLLDQAQLFVGSHYLGSGHLLLGHVRTDNVTTVKELFGGDLVVIEVP